MKHFLAPTDRAMVIQHQLARLFANFCASLSYVQRGDNESKRGSSNDPAKPVEDRPFAIPQVVWYCADCTIRSI